MDFVDFEYIYRIKNTVLLESPSFTPTTDIFPSTTKDNDMRSFYFSFPLNEFFFFI